LLAEEGLLFARFSMCASSSLSSWVLCYAWRSVNQSVLEYSTHLGLMMRRLLLSRQLRSLWQEDGYVVYNCYWSRQHSHSRVRVPWDSWPYFTVSDSRLPFLSPPTTRRAMVGVSDPTFTRVFLPWILSSCGLSRFILPEQWIPCSAIPLLRSASVVMGLVDTECGRICCCGNTFI
jgi:hypothetical protein